MVKPVIRPSNSCRLPYMSTSHRTRWPMRRSASWVSLKLASTQISVSERTAIRLCPAWTLLPGLTLRLVTTPSISLTDVAVTEVELGQREVAAGLVKLRLGLLDGRCLGNQVGKDAIEIAFRVLPLEYVEGLLRAQDPRRGSEPEQASAAVHLSQRLPDRRVILVEVVGNLAQVVARGRLGGQTQADSRRQHCLAGLDREPPQRP